MASGVGGEYTTLPSIVATGSLATSQYKIVKFGSTAGTVKVGAAGTDNCIGVLQNDPASGEAALVAVAGVCRVLAEASVSAGDLCASSSTGRAKATTTQGDNVVGIAAEASSSAGDYITLILTPGATYVGAAG